MPKAERYREIHNIVKQRAYYIVTMLADLHLPDHLDMYRMEDTFDPKYATMRVSENEVILTYDIPYSDYKQHWVVRDYWLDMSDEDVVKDYMDMINSKFELDRERNIKNLQRDAEYLGYEIVIKKENV